MQSKYGSLLHRVCEINQRVSGKKRIIAVHSRFISENIRNQRADDVFNHDANTLIRLCLKQPSLHRYRMFEANNLENMTHFEPFLRQLHRLMHLQ